MALHKKSALQIAALPPDVRRGCATPVICSYSVGLCPSPGLSPNAGLSPFISYCVRRGEATPCILFRGSRIYHLMDSVCPGRTRTMEEEQPVHALGQRACM